jgi:hypothetical protein
MHKVLDIAIKNLQQMSDTVFQSCLDILLEINPPKSNFMIFSKTLLEGNFFIKINEIPIKPCSSVKFVGLKNNSLFELLFEAHLGSKHPYTSFLIQVNCVTKTIVRLPEKPLLAIYSHFCYFE